MKILTRYDIVIIVFLFLLSISSYVFIGLTASVYAPEAVDIAVGNKPFGSYKLNEITSPKIVEINTEHGKNILKITEDGAQMIYASCKDHLDIKCGKITKPGQVIICIPNQVTVKLIGNSSEKVDKVTY